MIRSHVKDLASGNPFRMRGSVRTPSARPRDSDISAVQATGWIRMGEWTELMRPRVQHESPGMPASYSQAPLDTPGTEDASWRIRSQDTAEMESSSQSSSHHRVTQPNRTNGFTSVRL